MTAAGDTAPSVSVLRGYEEFIAIAAEWRELFADAERPTPYQRHSWLKVCWNVVWRRPYNRLRIVLVRENGRLVMAGAFVLGWRKLRPAIYLLHSRTPQYEDLVWRRGAATTAHASLVLSALRKELWLPRQLRLDQMREDSLLPVAVEARTGAVTGSNTSIVIPLHDYADFAAYFDSLSKKLRSDHRRQLKHLNDLPDFALEIEAGLDRSQVLDWLLNRKRQWLAETGHRAEWLRLALIDDIFHRLFAEAGDVPELWLSSLRVEGRIIAASLCFIERDTIYVSKIAHDPDYGNQSPGRTLMLEVIREAKRRGLSYGDLGQGEFGWKQRFSPGRCGLLRARAWLR